MSTVNPTTSEAITIGDKSVLVKFRKLSDKSMVVTYNDYSYIVESEMPNHYINNAIIKMFFMDVNVSKDETMPKIHSVCRQFRNKLDEYARES